MLWKLTKKQKEMSRLIDAHKNVLCIGQGRTGKSLLIVVKMFRDAIKHKNTNQAIFRNTLTSAVDGIWKITIKEVIDNFFPALRMMEGFKINETTHTITFPNGSMITIKGLDNTERVQKLLSTQWMRCFIDEAQLVNYEHFGMLMTRMPQPLDVDYKVSFVFAANWCPKSHWLKTFFEDGLNPETKAPHEQDIGVITSITQDNTTINAEEYLNTLNQAGDRRSRLACAGSGFYEEIEGALWEQSDIKRIEALDLKLYKDIVLAFDPAVSNTKSSDEHGIAICAKINGKYHVLNCFEIKKDVNLIAQDVCKLYHEYGCSKLLYEENNGGNWISSLIKNHDSKVLCHGIRANKGKLQRASPIAALYKNGLVFHCRHFKQLEDQMLTYTGNNGSDSPNALDALVHGLDYLSTGLKYADPNRI